MSIDNHLLREVIREQAEGKALRFANGSSAASIELPPEHNFNKQLRHDYNYVMQHVINPLIESGEIDDGTKTAYDDRKHRYNAPQITGNAVEFSFGITHFYAYLNDLNRDQGANERRRSLGAEHFGDKFAYFSCPAGIEVLPITADGSVFIGPRKSKKVYPGYLQAVGGHVEFSDPGKINIFNDVLRELREEYGIKEDALSGSPKFVGTARHELNGDVAICFIAHTKVHDDYFTSEEWKKHATEIEHTHLFGISSMSHLEQVLAEEKIVFPTRLALESIRTEEIRN